MVAAFQFELVSPEKLLLSDEVDEVVIPGSEGYLTVLERHAPVMTRLKPGIIRVKKTGQQDRAFVVLDGFADIGMHNCSVLAEKAVALKAADERDLDNRIEQVHVALQTAMMGDAASSVEDLLSNLA